MKQVNKKFLSLLLCTTLAFALLPARALAANGAISAGGTYNLENYGNSNTVTIGTTQDVTLTGNAGTTYTNLQIICSIAGVNLTLNNVNIDNSGVLSNISSLSFAGAGNNLTLAGDNILKSSWHQPGVEVASDTELTIGGTGTLMATGGDFGAGIGGDNGGSGGTVTITGGTVTATGGVYGAGIGGGGSTFGTAGSGAVVNISGGTICAVRGEAVSGGCAGYDIGGGGTISGSAGGAGTCVVTGGCVNAHSIQPTPNNGSINGAGTVFLTTVTLGGVSAAKKVVALTVGTSYPYGTTDLYTDNSGSLYLWLPTGTTVTAAMVDGIAYEGYAVTLGDGSTAGTLYMVPVVTSVSVPANGSYKAGDTLYFAVNFSESVMVGGSPYILLTVGGVTRMAFYVSGSGTSMLVFRYTVQTGDNDPDGITLASTIELSGGTIKNVDVNANRTLNNVGNTSGILVDTLAPAILAITPMNSAPYVSVSGTIIVTFGETMNPSAGTVTLNGATLTGGTWSESNKKYMVPYNGLSFNTPYTLEISEFQDTVGNAMIAYSGGFTTEPEPLTPSASPSDVLTVSKGGTATLTVSFGQGTSAAIGAGIMISDSGIASADPLFLTAAGTVTVTGLSAGTTILMVNFLTLPMPTVIAIPVTVQAAAPVWPSGSSLTASEITGAGITLSWTAATDVTAVTGYKIYRDEALIGTVDGATLSYTVTGLSASTAYGFQVQAGNADGMWTTGGPAAAVTTSAVPSGGSSGTYYAIRSMAGAGGSISPSGSVPVIRGGKKIYAISADEGYKIADVLVDGVSIGAVSTYTFEHIKGAHTISASFEKAAVPSPFTDVASTDWFYGSVLNVFERGLMYGAGMDTFDPIGGMTRAMAITVLYRMSGDTGSYNNGFTDVGSGTWYENAAAWAAENGISGGVGGGRFAPDSGVTRQQLAVLLYNYAKHMGCDVSVGENTNILSYGDASKISDYACVALQWACAAGIMNGDTNGNLNPQGSATRAEFAAIIERFIELVIR